MELPGNPRTTILLVEDESLIRDLLCAILSAHGYTTLVASRGKEALRICQEYPGPIHLLLTDVLMPEMNGKRLAEQVIVLRPRTKVLYMSAYPAGFLTASDISFIQKPFAADDILTKIAAVLGQPC